MLQKCPSISSLPLQFLMETQNNPIVYNHHRQPPSPAFTFNPNILNDSHEPEQALINTQQLAKEPMFQKTLTPSDVGKLNRLVIPKQHAQIYFPLVGDGDTGHQQKGLLLNFEDESAKLWRFRYSYWNSSQSYVLTKGWNRYVKEKRLDAGDLVLFERHRLDYERMFIGCRRLSADRMETPVVAQPVDGGGPPVSRCSTMVFHRLPLILPHQPNCLHADVGDVYGHVDNYQRGMVAPRRLRLFGVNLDCRDDSEPQTPDGSSHDSPSDHQYGYSSTDTRYD